MALILAKKAPVGIDGVYWRIVGIEMWYGGPNQIWPSEHAKPVTFVYLAQYISQKIATEGAMPLQIKRIVLDGASNSQSSLNEEFHKPRAVIMEPTREAIYTALKELPDWVDAIDG